MGFSRDGHPWVGELAEKKGIWVCGGFTGHGMPNAWLCGAAAAGMVIGKEEVAIPASYAADKSRFERARALDEVWLADSKALVGMK